MATKSTDTCLQKAADDEPIFVLRAQDRWAPVLVRLWAQLVMAHEGPGLNPKLSEALDTADQMEEWPTRKFPD